MTARDSFEGGAVVLRDRGPGVRRRESHPKPGGCMVHAAWVTCNDHAVSRISLSARMTFATPSDRVVEARSRLV